MMREYEIIFDEALRSGLSPLTRTPFNQQLLDECYGFRLGPGGPEIYESKTDPITGFSYDTNWPFPQMIEGERYNFFIELTDEGTQRIYAFSHDDPTDYASFILNSSPATPELVDAADFGLYAFLTNGTDMCYWDTVAGDWDYTTGTAEIPLMKTVCNFRGQAVGGHVLDGWYDCDEHFYVWSKIGELNFDPWVKNEAGFRRDPLGGEIYHTYPHGDSVIGYTSRGTTQLFSVAAPAATFGSNILSDIGLLKRGAVATSDTTHLFIGNDYRLKKISNVGELSYRLGVVDIGYEHFIRELDESKIIINHDRRNNDFYISDGNKTFLFNKHGMTESPQHPSAIWCRRKETYFVPDDEDDFKCSIATSPFDMTFSGQKTISSIETDAWPVAEAEGAIDYLLRPGVFETTPYTPMNNEGNCVCTAAGSAFRIRLRFDPDYANTKMSYLRARYKMTDMRAIRGVYAPPPRGQ